MIGFSGARPSADAPVVSSVHRTDGASCQLEMTGTPPGARSNDDRDRAQVPARNHHRPRTRLLFDGPAIRCVLLQAVVNPIFVKVGNDFAPEVELKAPGAVRRRS